MRQFLLCLSMLLGACAGPSQKLMSGPKADYVVLEKSGKSITLWSQGKILKSYAVMALGPNPYGHKIYEGDGKTPEGLYLIDEKHISERYQKFLRVSYPNAFDRMKAQSLGLNPGGFVGIHGDKGGAEGFFDRMKEDWTQGCISVTNSAIEEIYALVDVGTPILIKP